MGVFPCDLFLLGINGLSGVLRKNIFDIPETFLTLICYILAFLLPRTDDDLVMLSRDVRKNAKIALLKSLVFFHQH